jgi:superkiller protein 3
MTTNYFKLALVAIIAGVMVMACETGAYAQEAVQQESFGQTSDEPTAEKYVKMGYNAGKNGFNELAIDFYKQALNIDPRCVEAYNGMGAAHANLQEYKEAIECYRKAMEIAPNDAKVHSGMGFAYYGLKSYPEAIKRYKKAIALDPSYAPAHCNMGLLYYDYIRDYFEAIDYYQKAIDVDPNFAEAYYYMGIAYANLAKDNNPKQIKYYQTAAQLGHDGAREWLKSKGHSW